jgi:hypothetical protein
MAFYPLAEEPGYCMSGIAVGGVGPFYLDNEWLVCGTDFRWFDKVIVADGLTKVGDVFLKNVYFSTDESRNEVSIAKSLPWGFSLTKYVYLYIRTIDAVYVSRFPDIFYEFE